MYCEVDRIFNSHYPHLYTPLTFEHSKAQKPCVLLLQHSVILFPKGLVSHASVAMPEFFLSHLVCLLYLHHPYMYTMGTLN